MDKNAVIFHNHPQSVQKLTVFVINKKNIKYEKINNFNVKFNQN